MTGIHEIRYTLEHRMLPGWLYGEGQRLTELLTERPLFVYEVLCDILKKKNWRIRIGEKTLRQNVSVQTVPWMRR